MPPVSDQPTITPATGQNDTFTLGASERKTLQYTLAGYTEWRLDDPSGKIAKSIDGNVVTLTIDASQYAAGSYTAELLAVNGTKTAKRTIAYTVSEGDNPTGISMDFYPNPCTDVLNILPNYSGESTIRIRNSMGTEVMNITLGLINEEPVKLDVSGLASGTYLVQVTYNGIQITRTIVKTLKQTLQIMKKIFILAIILLSGTAAASAQEFLTINPDVRTAGMANASVATTGGAYSVFQNAASSLFSHNLFEVGFSYSPWMRDVKKGYDLMPRRILLLQPQTFDLVRTRFTGSRSSVRTTRTTLSFPKTRIITQSSASKRSGRSAFRRIWPTAIGSAAIWVCR